MAAGSVWFVVHTRTGKELLVASLLAEQLQLETYLPEVLRLSKDGQKLTPLFPGYLFVCAGANRPETAAVHTTPGVIRLVAFGTEPQPVAATVIEHLRKEVDALNARGGLAPHSFVEGQRVRITHGPLEGLEAIFTGPMHPTRRVRVLLEFLGRLQQVEVPVDELETASPHPPRRTRGKGRTIHAPATPGR